MHWSSQVLQSITPYILQHCSILLQLVYRESSRFIESDTSRVCCVWCLISAPAAGRWWSSGGAPEGPWRRRARRVPAPGSLSCPAGQCTATGRWGWEWADAATDRSRRAVRPERRGPWTHLPVPCRLWPRFRRMGHPPRGLVPPLTVSRLPALPGPLYSRRPRPVLSRDVLISAALLWRLGSHRAARRLHRKSLCHPNWTRAERCHLRRKRASR